MPREKIRGLLLPAEDMPASALQDEKAETEGSVQPQWEMLPEIKYPDNPFITFDTLYEEGRYVIFAVSTVSTDVTHWRYVDFARLLSPYAENREQVITDLYRFSLYAKRIDVQPEDQILLLMTCTEDDTQRRVIAARRIRADETEETLRQEVARVRLR